MTKTQLKNRLIKTPGYLRWGTWRLMSRFMGNEYITQAYSYELVRDAKKAAQRYIVKNGGSY